MKLRAFLISIALALSFTSTAEAVTKPIKVLPVQPNLITNLSGSKGDQISAITSATAQIILVGTLESTTTSVLNNSSALGGSDGFITSLSPTGDHLWDLRLGGATDDIACALVRDKTGSIWIAGASAKPTAAPTTPVPDTSSINIDAIDVDPISIPSNTLTQIILWKVSLLGQLQATYTYDFGGFVAPNSLAFDGTNFTIGGVLENQSFSLKVSELGEFSKLIKTNVKKESPVSIQTLKAGTGTMKSFISKTAITGIPSWKPKSPIPVLIEYNKAKAITRASYFKGKVIAVTWQAGIGPIVITELSEGYGINILGLAK